MANSGSRGTSIVKAIEGLRMLIPPEGVATYVNGDLLPNRIPVRVFQATLPTVVADADGILKRTRRRTSIRVFDPRPGEPPSVYEIGIPVVETGDRWHVDIGQKVPLNMDRDNVQPSYFAGTSNAGIERDARGSARR